MSDTNEDANLSVSPHNSAILMNKFHSLVAVALAAASLSATQALASTITYETRSITAPVGPDYAATWAAQGSGITSNTLSDFNGTVPGGNSFAHLSVSFNVGAPASAMFQLAPDAGYGGAMYLDGVLIDYENTDLWWGGSWGNIAELLASANIALSTGAHNLEAFWAEGCCSGGQGGRFSVDNGVHWQALSVPNLDALAVPEPGTLVLLGAGLAALGLRRRKLAA